MAPDSPDLTPARSGSWLDRLKAMMAPATASDSRGAPPDGKSDDEAPETAWQLPALSAPEPVPLALAVERRLGPIIRTKASRRRFSSRLSAGAPNDAAPGNLPLALPVDTLPDTGLRLEALPPPDGEPAPPEAEPVADEPGAVDGKKVESAELAAPVELPPEAAAARPAGKGRRTGVILEPAPAPQVIACPVCQSLQASEQESCGDCGYYFTSSDRAGGAASTPEPLPAHRLQGRYELRESISRRHDVERFRGLDHGTDGSTPAPVFIARQPVFSKPDTVPIADLVSEAPAVSEDIIPSFDDVFAGDIASTAVLPASAAWPGLEWERNLLQSVEQPALPSVLDSFVQGEFEYLVVEAPAGRSLWDSWDDPETTSEHRFGWLAQLAEALVGLHGASAMLEAIRPELAVIDDSGRARLCDITDVLPLPVPPDVSVRGTLYTAPELLASPGTADARAGLYSFGAMLYALHVGRELQEIDFDRPGHPKPFIPRFPDIHPAFGRLVSKTFRREPASRFPSDEAVKVDATGFTELIQTLNVLKRTLDQVRMEVGSWTTTGMVRTGNEDAFALLHACESRQDDLGEQVLILLADGMGGYEAGEVAAALTLQVLREQLVQQEPFTALGGKPVLATDPLAPAGPAGHGPAPVDIEAAKRLIMSALKAANKRVFETSRAPGSRRRGMGCTAEVVFLDGRNVIVGHVGDSRTYHLHEGRMLQMTRDQTLVNRLVELGQLTAEEAEAHPRRNELQQAVGGQPDVKPELYHGQLKPGDWVLVCSDGLSNHVSSLSLKEMLLSEAQSAEMATRRLVNLANIEGATDNATVVVVRCT